MKKLTRRIFGKLSLATLASATLPITAIAKPQPNPDLERIRDRTQKLIEAFNADCPPGYRLAGIIGGPRDQPQICVYWYGQIALEPIKPHGGFVIDSPEITDGTWIKSLNTNLYNLVHDLWIKYLKANYQIETKRVV